MSSAILSAAKTSRTFSSIVVAPPGSANSDCAWVSDVTTHVPSTASLPRVKMPVTVTTSSAPSVDVIRMRSPTPTPRSSARVDPTAMRPLVMSKVPRTMRDLRSMMDGNESASTPRITMGTRASARVAVPDPLTVGDAAVTPSTRAAACMTAGHWSSDRRRWLAGCRSRAMARPSRGSTRGLGSSRGTRRITWGCEPSVDSMSDDCRPLMSADRNTMTLTPTDTAASISADWPRASSR